MKFNSLKKGDIVARKSYGMDIAFFINDIIDQDHTPIAILKGVTVRIIADSPLDDLVILSDTTIKNVLLNFDSELQTSKINKIKSKIPILKRNYVQYGRILHLDGDKKYSEKSQKFYKNIGLNVIVKNVAEKKQPQMITGLLNRYTPDILVVTGHDGIIKKEHNFNDIYNYRNSRFFVETVIRARMWENRKNKLSIFAGACQSYYEALISAGANFASSPARILIDFKDPLVVAQKIAMTEESDFISIKDIEYDLRDGKDGVNGIGSYGKKIIY